MNRALRILGLALWHLLGGASQVPASGTTPARITYSEHTERLAAFALAGELDERQEGFR